ncbi:MAG: FGGY-family carbohydrate kinase, partial [Verrucomicrobiota bacterium]|nr:FGGY-family carbohydrate kinase [Verrucomicrobiota bacterium]
APDFNRRLALIGGTSSCHMAVSSEKRVINGVWGPYYSAMVPGKWLNEGGQSATGALVDHIIFNHGASDMAQKAARAAGVSLYEYLNQILDAISTESDMDELTKSIHVCPYFHGNRSPRADPNLLGMVSGLKLSATVEDLALLYLATVQSIAYGTKHIIESMNLSGYEIDTLVCCGGGTKNRVFMQQHANATGCRLLTPKEPESVLLGAAMLGAVAAGDYENIETAMVTMSEPGKIINLQKSTKNYHKAKYKVFQRLYDDQIAYLSAMSSY